MLGHTEEQVVGHLAAVVEHRDAARPVERAHPAAGDELDAALGESGDQRAEVSGEGGTGLPSGITKEISQSERTPRADR